MTVYDHAISCHFQPPPPVPPRVIAAADATVTGTVSMDDADVDSDLAATENKNFVIFLKLLLSFVVLNKTSYLDQFDLFRFFSVQRSLHVHTSCNYTFGVFLFCR